jgi:hypothetical protein
MAYDQVTMENVEEFYTRDGGSISLRNVGIY